MSLKQWGKVWVHPYELQPTDRRRSPRKGFLLKLQNQNFEAGFGDCMSWPELGDPDLETLMKALVEIDRGVPLPALLDRCLTLAIKDGQARAESKFLLADQEKIRNHFLITDLTTVTSESLDALWKQGFRTLKIKTGSKPDNDFRILLDRLSEASAAFQLRLDFNGGMSADWLPLLAEQKEVIEFVEDPYSEVDRRWEDLHSELGVSLARDFAKMQSAELSASFQYYICKPAREATEDLLGLRTSHRVVFTSYLGHPLGQARDCSEALAPCTLGSDFSVDCGLLSQHAYEANTFSSAIAATGPRPVFPGQRGVGFDSQLEAVSWKPLF